MTGYYVLTSRYGPVNGTVQYYGPLPKLSATASSTVHPSHYRIIWTSSSAPDGNWWLIGQDETLSGTTWLSWNLHSHEAPQEIGNEFPIKITPSHPKIEGSTPYERETRTTTVRVCSVTNVSLRRFVRLNTDVRKRNIRTVDRDGMTYFKNNIVILPRRWMCRINENICNSCDDTWFVDVQESWP